MKIGMIASVSAVVAAMIFALVADGCSSSATSCDCIAPGAHVHIPSGSEAAVTGVRLSGPACDGLTATCSQPLGVGCSVYSFSPVNPGACTVDVVFVDATFTADVTFAQTTGCCSGIYPSPASAGEIDATRAPGDGGGPG